MKVVIEIPEEKYEWIKNHTGVKDHRTTQTLYESVRNGTPLPKGHGRLVDLSKIDDDMIESDNPIIYLTINGEDIEAVSLDYLDDLPIIIPEDKDEENV